MLKATDIMLVLQLCPNIHKKIVVILISTPFLSFLNKQHIHIVRVDNKSKEKLHHLCSLTLTLTT